MASVTYSREWTRQPEWNAPPSGAFLNRGVALINPAAMPFDLVTGIGLTPAGTAALSNGSLETTAANGSKWEAAASDIWSVSTTDFTLEVLVVMTSRASLSHIFGLGQQDTATGVTAGCGRGILSFGGGSNDQIYFWGASADLASGVSWRTDGSVQHVFITATGGTMRFYRDGAQIATGATPSLTATPSPAYLTVGGRHSGGTVSPAIKVLKGSVRNYAMTAEQVAELTANPWLDFEPEPVSIYWSSSSTTTTALSAAGAAIGTLVGAETTTATLSATGAAVGTLVTASNITTDLSSTGATVGTLVGEAVDGATTTDLSTAGAAVGTLGTTATITADLSSTAAAVGTLVGAAIDNSAPTDLSATGAAVGTAATASIAAAVLTSDGVSIGTLEALAISGYETADLSAAGAAVGTMAGAAIIGAALSAAGAAVARLATVEPSTSNAYLTWGAQARRIRQRQEEDDEEILQMVASMLPMIKRGSHGKSYSRPAVRRNR